MSDKECCGSLASSRSHSPSSKYQLKHSVRRFISAYISLCDQGKKKDHVVGQDHLLKEMSAATQQIRREIVVVETEGEQEAVVVIL